MYNARIPQQSTQLTTDGVNDELLRLARVKQRRENGTTHVRVRGLSPVIVFAATVIVTAVVLSFAYPIASMAGVPRLILMAIGGTAMGIAAIIGAAMAIRRQRHIRAGYDDLIIDDAASAISLPLNFGRKSPKAIAFDSITDIAPAEMLPRMDDVLDADSFGPRTFRKRKRAADSALPKVEHRSALQYAVVVCWSDSNGNEVMEPIVSWYDLQRANAFANWLHARLKLHAH